MAQLWHHGEDYVARARELGPILAAAARLGERAPRLVGGTCGT